ncbi:MAG: 4Fe-4S dicluster domain-containing protein [Armatimonadota bacterium]|nr:4Fe-4S dicluster domain-containing protein [Armatimonadota bacterium]
MRISRRGFLQGIGVSFGGFGLMTLGYDRLVPYIHQPDELVPGVSTWYATSCRECPAGCGMVLRSRESRVVKCEGNPHHPVNRGRLCARGQAALHGLYDPDRIKGPLRRDSSGEFTAAKWDEAVSAVGAELKGKRIAFVTDLQTGSLASLTREWLAALGSDRLVTYEPIDYENIKTAAGGVVPSFNIAAADHLISFGADFLETWISPVEYARRFAEMRQIKNGKRARFVYVGPRMSMTAANADERIIVPPGAEAQVAEAFSPKWLGVAYDPLTPVAHKYGLDKRSLSRVSNEFIHAKAPLALPGGSAETARASMALNAPETSSEAKWRSPTGLADPGRPHAVTHISSRSEMTALTADMEAGKIDALVVFGANPVYSLPQSAGFKEALKHVKTVVSLSSYMDETTAQAHWVLPSSAPLETWGDYSPYPDTINLMQPVMGQLFDTKQTGDILIELAKASGVEPRSVFHAETFYDYLRRRWGIAIAPGEAQGAGSPEWESHVQIGGRWPGSGEAATPTTGYQTMGWSVEPIPSAVPAPPPTAPSDMSDRPDLSDISPRKGDIKLHAYPHIYFYDGRGANRRWLQEMPDPIIHGVWGTWAELHPRTASKLGVETNDLIDISRRGAAIRVPVYVTSGVAPDTVAVPIGEGHEEYGRYARGIGANVLPLLDTESPTVEITPAGESKWLTRIKGAISQNGRNIVQTTPLDKPFRREEEIALPLPAGYKWKDFYPGHEHAGHRWAMAIDLDKCIGCGACVTACYAENNLGVVGPDGIYRKREMSWIRIDRYVDWKSQSPILFQPMLCQHCDAAPCEPVCPVYASAHSEEGVNMQIYNRCVGTRYCANNCPYKVRRFNWFDYEWPSPMHYQLNPDVTVRSRGVMEKCTFCIQRIREAEIVAKHEGRKLKDGDIVPACAQTCPTGVFAFGDLMDPDSQVSKAFRDDPRAYQVLAELNTKTAVLYLKKIVEGS